MAGTKPGQDEKRIIFMWFRKRPKMLDTFSVRLSGRLGELAVRIDDEFARHARVE
jgi:hypothetical protein